MINEWLSNNEVTILKASSKNRKEDRPLFLEARREIRKITSNISLRNNKKWTLIRSITRDKKYMLTRAEKGRLNTNASKKIEKRL